jgi:HlyD family secretion protein
MPRPRAPASDTLMAAQRRTWVGFAVAAAVVAALGAGARLTHKPAPSVAVARAQFGPLTSWISTNGVIEPVEPHVIASRVSAFVAAIPVVEGQSVARGDLLLRLDVEPQRADLARAREALAKAENDVRVFEAGGPAGERAQIEADLRTAEAEVEQARGQRDATERLVSKQAATSTEFAQARLTLERAEATRDALAKKRQALRRDSAAQENVARLAVRHSQEAVRVLEQQVESASVRAPADGVVYSMPAKRGVRVEPGTVLASVADLTALRLRAFVDEPDLGSVEPEQAIEVSWSGLPNQQWQGRVLRVPKAVVARGDRTVGEVICSVTGDGQRLIPGLGVDVRIRVFSSTHSLLVPRNAVRSDSGGRYVFVVEDGVVRRRPVVVGLAGAAQSAVSSGLREGEWVALPSDLPLSDGMRVERKDAS